MCRSAFSRLLSPRVFHRFPSLSFLDETFSRLQRKKQQNRRQSVAARRKGIVHGKQRRQRTGGPGSKEQESRNPQHGM